MVDSTLSSNEMLLGCSRHLYVLFWRKCSIFVPFLP